MRTLGALVLVTVLAAVAGVRVCTNRDISLVVAEICNIHRRSVRSLHDLPESPGSPGWLPASRHPRMVLPEHLKALKDDSPQEGVNSGNTGFPSRLVKRASFGDLRHRCCKNDCNIEEFLGACS